MVAITLRVMQAEAKLVIYSGAAYITRSVMATMTAEQLRQLFYKVGLCGFAATPGRLSVNSEFCTSESEHTKP